MRKITIYIVQSKRKIMRVLLLYGLSQLFVPIPSQAGIHYNTPDPARFALANIISVPSYRMYDARFHDEWLFITGGARLFGLSEIQPFALFVSGPVASGRLALIAEGLNVASYHEICGTISWQQPLPYHLKLEVLTRVNRIKIDGYGSTFASSLEIRGDYLLREGLFLNAVWTNVAQSEFGEGGYGLPKGFAFGIDYRLQKLATLFFEIEKDSRYPMQTRIAATANVWGPLGVLFGYQTNPDIASFGVKVSHRKINITAAYQYHTDLGISQCYGLSLIF